MKSWFTVEQIDSETFAISEYGHWEEPHCYLLRGQKKAILIDSGLGVADIGAVADELTDLPITVLTTHAHWDHIGGHRYFDRIAVHDKERDWLSVRFPLSDETVRASLTARPCVFPAGFDAKSYRVFHGEPQVLLHDGDTLDLGGRTVRVVHTPGHSPGHCCFYEPERKYLYAGDLIYQGRLYAFYPSTDPHQFYESVKKIGRYDVARAFPGHHRLDIPVSLTGEIADGFAEIARNGLLKQGSGLFRFKEFQIQI